MKLLKLVIVDDEPILLEGLLKTYDWAGMGFEVVGSARDGDQAIQVIKDKKPNVVLTDIRMKKVSGLQVMQEIEKEKICKKQTFDRKGGTSVSNVRYNFREE